MSSIPTGSGESVEQFVLPLFVGRRGDKWQPIRFVGTGFVIGPELLVTCWHCVSATLAEGEEYAAAISTRRLGEYDKALQLINIQQDLAGSDLATAMIDIQKTPLRLAGTPASTADQVCAYGYPLTQTLREGEQQRFRLHGRYLQGYVTQDLFFDHPVYGRVPSYELDMPAPEGLSGAPLLNIASGEVTGVIYGTNDVALVEALATVQPETGLRMPEVHRVVSFALAYYLTPLQQLSGRATHNLPLRDYVKSFAEGSTQPP